MSDEPVPEVQPESVNPEPRSKRSYTDEDRYIALAAVDLNGGNVYRTSVALGIPATTLYDWVNERSERISLNSTQFANGRREKRGDLASKLEDKIHSVIEAISPEKIEKATLSQSGVFIGIGIDKLRLLRGQGLEPDPATELCKLLGINRTELPERLELGPGDELPTGFGFSGPIIDAELEPSHPTQNPAEPAISLTHAPDCDLNIPCSCGAHDALFPAENRNSSPINPSAKSHLPDPDDNLIHDEGVKMTQDRSSAPPEEPTEDTTLLDSLDDEDSAN